MAGECNDRAPRPVVSPQARPWHPKKSYSQDDKCRQLDAEAEIEPHHVGLITYGCGNFEDGDRRSWIVRPTWCKARSPACGKRLTGSRLFDMPDYSCPAWDAQRVNFATIRRRSESGANATVISTVRALESSGVSLRLFRTPLISSAKSILNVTHGLQVIFEP